MQRSAASLVTRDVQIKTTMKGHLIPASMAVTEKPQINAGKDVEKGTRLHCWWEYELVKPLWRTVWNFLKKLKIELTYDPAIPLLDIHLENTIRKDICTPMSTAALFTAAKTQTQPRRPSPEEWIKKMWYIYTKEYYSAMKKNERLCSHMDGPGECHTE